MIWRGDTPLRLVPRWAPTQFFAGDYLTLGTQLHNPDGALHRSPWRRQGPRSLTLGGRFLDTRNWWQITAILRYTKTYTTGEPVRISPGKLQVPLSPEDPWGEPEWEEMCGHTFFFQVTLVEKCVV